MRTTIELGDALHERMQRQARREGIALSRLLGRLVEQGLHAQTQGDAAMHDSGRFCVMSPASAGTITTTDSVQKVIDEEGVL